MTRVKFRHSGAATIAGLVAFFGAIPVAGTHWYFAPILLVPLAVAVWSWRAGTDADEAGVSVRALFGRRRLRWDQITGFVHANRRVRATLVDHREVPLPAVSPADLARLVAAGGQELTGDETTVGQDRPQPPGPQGA